MLDVSPVSFVCRLRQHARIHLLIPSDMKVSRRRTLGGEYLCRFWQPFALSN